MKNKIIILAFFLLAGVALKAQGYGSDRYSISAYAGYAVVNVGRDIEVGFVRL